MYRVIENEYNKLRRKFIESVLLETEDKEEASQFEDSYRMTISDRTICDVYIKEV